MNDAIIICGPTASGKTDFAHKLAINTKSEIVNADSMQLYKQIPIITASPTKKLQDNIPYHLYNVQSIDQELSAIKYVDIASNVIKNISSKGKLPIIVGGSGLYISMLISGYNIIPDIDHDIRSNTRSLHEKIGPKLFFEKLKQLDPKIKEFLHPLDSQRTIRAYEVFKQTNRSILDFQKCIKYNPLSNFKFNIILLLPERDFLYQRCEERLKKIFNSGAVDEIALLYKDYKNLQTTGMKALGVQDIIQYIKGNISITKALNNSCIKTRQYAKRQNTWFKNRVKVDKLVEFNSDEQFFISIEQLLDQSKLIREYTLK